jgi:hypothetical protein
LVLLLSPAPLPGQFVVTANTNDADIFDFNGDNQGDLVWSASGAIIIVGENGADGFEHRSIFPFALNQMERTAIANAQAITLDLQLFRATNVFGFQVDLFGLANRTTTVPTPTDFEAVAENVQSGAIVGQHPARRISFDVTEFAKTEAARGDNSVVVFRAQIAPDVPNGDSLFNQYIFVTADAPDAGQRPTLTVIPAAPKVIATISRHGTNAVITWTGGSPPYGLESTTGLPATNWIPVLTTDSTTATIPIGEASEFYRIHSQ